MKKLIILMGFIVACTAAIPFKADAQVSVSINIGSQPAWGPAGYQYVDYYYLPDIESYYYVPARQFVYLSNGNWVFSASLPSRYRNYDLYRGYKVVINQPRPYLYYSTHKVKYKKYKGYYGHQNSIRYSDKGYKHGTPPGQAKKYYSSERYNSHGKKHGKHH